MPDAARPLRLCWDCMQRPRERGSIYFHQPCYGAMTQTPARERPEPPTQGPLFPNPPTAQQLLDAANAAIAETDTAKQEAA